MPDWPRISRILYAWHWVDKRALRHTQWVCYSCYFDNSRVSRGSLEVKEGRNRVVWSDRRWALFFNKSYNLNLEAACLSSKMTHMKIFWSGTLRTTSILRAFKDWEPNISASLCFICSGRFVWPPPVQTDCDWPCRANYNCLSIVGLWAKGVWAWVVS